VFSIGKSNFAAEGMADFNISGERVLAAVFGDRGLGDVRGIFVWFAWD
jgi:hypothetical protein